MTATTRRRLIVPALLAAAALTVAGCGTPSAGAAAVADGRRVSVAQLQNATVQLKDITDNNQQFGQGRVLQFLVMDPWVVDIAAKYGVGVSTDQALQEIRKANPAYDPASSAPSHKTAAPETIEVVRAFLALQAVQGANGGLSQQKSGQAVAELQAKVKGSKLDINPRYLGGTPNWLVGGDPASLAAAPQQQPGQTP